MPARLPEIGTGIIPIWCRKSSIVRALINQGFDVVDVKLSRNSQLLDSLDVLVVSEPREPFSEEELDKLYRYVESGKNFDYCGKTEDRTVIWLR